MFVAVIYRPGSAWIAGKGVLEQPLKEHFVFMEEIFNQGRVVMGGPFSDDAGIGRALVILQVDDMNEANALMAKDPIVVNQIAVAEIHPWQVLLQRSDRDILEA